jgi:hypothetical protein
MNMPGFTAALSLHSSSEALRIGRQILSSGHSTGRICPAKLKDEEAGVNCDTCFGAQCVELGCLRKSLDLGGGTLDPVGPGVGGGGGGGGTTEPCLNSHVCTKCIPSGPSIFSPGRQFCTDSFCSATFGGKCQCTVFKGFRSCTLPTPVLTTRRLGLAR